MNKYLILMAASVLGAAVAGCSEDTYDISGEGNVKISARINSDVAVVSRAATEEELAEKCNVWISSTKGLVRKYEGLQNVPASGITLLSGQYVAEAWTGDSVPASFDAKYFKGYQPFTVAAGETTQVELVCKVANTVVSVNYDEALDDLLKGYTLTVKHTRGELTFEGRDERKGYFMMPNGVHDLNYTLTGTKADGSTFTRSGVIPDVKPTTEYAMSVKVGSDDSPIGGGFVTIEIDERELVIEHTVVIATAPQFMGQDFDINAPLYAELNKVGRRSLWIMGSSALKTLVLEADNLGSLLGISGNDVDLLSADEAVKNQVKAAGISVLYTYDAEADVSKCKVSFEEELLNRLPAGNYDFRFSARDANNKGTTATFALRISDADIEASETVPGEIWATRATLHGSLINTAATNPSFEYRAAGSTDWTRVPAVAASRAGSEVMAVVSGLTPGTTYEYRVCTDSFTGTRIMRFTTEAAAQIENGGFESWVKNGSGTWLAAASESALFWDSGNHGSITMNKNVTFPDETVKHSGNYSAKLQSQFVGVGVIGKFAAGNLFIGKYLHTEGTNGILGWGRTFTSRPTKLRGWVKYEPKTVDKYTDSKAPDIVKGQLDKGIVYVALLDQPDDSQLDKDYKNYPVVVRTKSPGQYFDRNASYVIAYGEMVWDKATDGSGLVQFEIPLNYNDRTRKPKYLMLTCAASKGGDYFAGADGSVMYLDDFEFVYE